MTEAPKRIWATEDSENFGEDRFHTTQPVAGLTEYIRADEVQRLIDEAVEKATRVKPLVWLRDDDGNGISLPYEIRAEGTFWVWFCDDLICTRCDTEEAAIAAANAHNEQRIRAAIGGNDENE